ncbi:MAG TPA: ATP-binding protein [Tepidiformaceae bacterium]|nr:ATP-binding protein [Tepidiformaceae bacterium]
MSGEWVVWQVPVGVGLLVSSLLLAIGLLLERTRRRRAEVLLGERLQFETLLSEQVATFSRISAVEVDREIQRALRRIADLLGVDWGNLTEYSDDSRTARVTHWSVADGVGPQPSAIGFEEIPWVVTRLRRGEPVRFSRIEELPEDDALVDRRTYRRLGVKSQVAVPLKVEGVVVGALAFSTLGAERAWRDEFVQRLHLLGDVFAHTLSRRRSEMEGQRLRQDLAHVGRVSTMGELTASLAHELNQPLTAILSNAQAAQRILASGRTDLAEIREILGDIVEDDKRAGEVIHRLRGFLKKSSVELAALDIGELVGQVARLVSSDAIIRNVAIRLDLETGLPPVCGDRVQLQQVVLNLLMNGLDAMRESPETERALVLRTHRGGPGRVAVAVEDSGVGIAEADAEVLFHPFYTTKADGLGMGLAIARSIVEAHGGRLEARNNPRCGATFSFTLPAAEQEA